MAKKKARIVEKQGAITPNGRDAVLQLRKGEKGTGEVVQSVRMWPWSPRSVEAAHDIMRQVADRANLDIVPQDPDED